MIFVFKGCCFPFTETLVELSKVEKEYSRKEKGTKATQVGFFEEKLPFQHRNLTVLLRNPWNSVSVVFSVQPCELMWCYIRKKSRVLFEKKGNYLERN